MKYVPILLALLVAGCTGNNPTAPTATGPIMQGPPGHLFVMVLEQPTWISLVGARLTLTHPSGAAVTKTTDADAGAFFDIVIGQPYRLDASAVGHRAETRSVLVAASGSNEPSAFVAFWLPRQ